jgi:hypothetical protein
MLRYCVACDREPALYPSALNEPRIGEKCYEKMKFCMNPKHDHNIDDDIACMECFAHGSVFESKQENPVIDNDNTFNMPTDVVWTDTEMNTYHLHSVILSRQSKVFSHMYEEKQTHVHPMNFPSNIIKDLIKLMYLQYDYHYQSIDTILNHNNMVELWKICHQYECLIETSVASFIMDQKFDDLTNEIMIDILKTAISFRHSEMIRLCVRSVVKTQKIEVLKSLMKCGVILDNVVPCYANEPIAIFSPEPKSKTDVTWTDGNLNTYHLHLVVLARHSHLFPQHIEDSPTNVKAFAELCYLQYGEDPTMLTLETMIPLWKMCHKYNCPHLASVVWNFISFKCSHGDVPDDLLLELLRNAVNMDRKDAVVYILEHIIRFQLTGIMRQFFGVELYDDVCPINITCQTNESIGVPKFF